MTVVWSGIRRESVENERVCLSEEKRRKMKGRKETTVKREKRDICEMSGWRLNGLGGHVWSQNI